MHEFRKVVVPLAILLLVCNQSEGLEIVSATFDYRDLEIEEWDVQRAYSFAIYTIKFDSEVYLRNVNGTIDASDNYTTNSTLLTDMFYNTSIFEMNSLLLMDPSHGLGISFACEDISVQLTATESIDQMALYLTKPVTSPLVGFLKEWRSEISDGLSTIIGEENATLLNDTITFVQVLSCYETNLSQVTEPCQNITVSQNWSCGRASDRKITFSLEPSLNGSEGSRYVVDDGSAPLPETSVEVTQPSPECTVDSLESTAGVFEAVVDKVNSAGTKDELQTYLRLLAFHKVTDGFAQCGHALEGMAKLSDASTYVPGARLCAHDYGSEAWRSDPCCNPSADVEQCCAATDQLVQRNASSLDPAEAASIASPEAAMSLERGLLGYEEVLELQNDPVAGCAAIKSGRKARWEGYLDFYDECKAILEGNITCESDADCYTSCDNSTCAAASETDYFDAFMRCASAKMDGTMLSFLKAALQLGPGASEQEVKEALTDEACGLKGASSGNSSNSSDSSIGAIGDQCDQVEECNDDGKNLTECQGLACLECDQASQTCKDVSAPSSCASTYPLEGDECTARGGEPGADRACTFDAEACYSGATLCSGNNVDMCTLFDLCHISSVKSQTVCHGKRAKNKLFPLWVSPSIAVPSSIAAPARDLIQKMLQYYSGPAFCLHGVSSAWYGNATFGVESCPAGSDFWGARTFTPARRANETTCSLPPTAVPDWTGDESGSCNASCPRCESKLDGESGPFKLCVNGGIGDEDTCVRDKGMWSSASSTCYKTAILTKKDGYGCPPNYGPKQCVDYGDRDACEDPSTPEALQCFWNDRAPCIDRAACEGAGVCAPPAEGASPDRAACEAERKCVYDDGQATSISAAVCGLDCNGADFQWRSTRAWSPGVWTAGTPRVTREWTNRTTVNRTFVPESALDEHVRPVFERALVQIAARDALSGALCGTYPLMDLFDRVGCALAGECPDAPRQQQIATTKAFPDAGVLWRSPMGWIALEGGGEVDDISAPEILVSRLPAADLARTPASADVQSCAAWSPPGSSLQVVGSGLALEGLQGGALRVCLRTSPAVGVCIDKYPIADFAKGDGASLVPLKVQVEVEEKTQELCGTVDTDGLSSVSIVPIRRAEPSLSKPAVTVKLSLDIPSKRLLTDARLGCLATAVGAALRKVPGPAASVGTISAVPNSIGDTRRADGKTVVQVTMSVEVPDDGTRSKMAADARALGFAKIAASVQQPFDEQLALRRLDRIAVDVLDIQPAPTPPPPPPAKVPAPSVCLDGGSTCDESFSVLDESPDYSIDPTKPFAIAFKGVNLTIPEGAWPLGETRPLRIRFLALTANSSLASALGRMSGARTAGRLAYFSPSGILFRRPVSLFLELDVVPVVGADLPPLAVYRFNATSRAWEARAACPADTAAPKGQVCGQTSTFSAYAPLAVPAPSGGGDGRACGDGCIAGAVIGSVFGAALIAFLVYWFVFRPQAAAAAGKDRSAPAGITPDQAREEGRAAGDAAAQGGGGRTALGMDLSKRAPDSPKAEARPVAEPRVNTKDEAEWDV